MKHSHLNTLLDYLHIPNLSIEHVFIVLLMLVVNTIPLHFRKKYSAFSLFNNSNSTFNYQLLFRSNTQPQFK